jgi:hypothetical protein
VDDLTAVKLLTILRPQQHLIGNLSLEVQALADCLNTLPDFQKSFEQRKHEVAPAIQKGLQPALDSIDRMIRELKKSNGGG